MAHPAMTMATAGSKASLALELPDDHPAIRITAPSTDGARRLPCRARKKALRPEPYGFAHDCRCRIRRLPSIAQGRNGFSHLDNIAAAA
jgi:hypothetical protein